MNIIDEMIEVIKNEIVKGEIFLIKDLCVGIKWKRLSKGERIAVGLLINREVKEGKLKGIVEVVKVGSSIEYQKL